jgi:hypothetical protein
MLLRCFAVVLVSVALAGCQVISASITSPSDWVSGTGRSISGSFEGLSVSSGSEGAKQSSSAYRRDVRAYSAEFASAGGSSADFLRGIGRVAGHHGVTHWESNDATLVAIGEGLRDAGVSPSEMETLGARTGDADPRVVARVLEGYSAAR